MRMDKKTIFILLLIAESITLLYLSTVPYLESIPISQLVFLRPGDLEHSIAYLIYGFLAFSSFRFGKKWYLAGIIASFFGILNEAIQAFTPGRVADPIDILNNSMFGFLGAYASFRLKE